MLAHFFRIIFFVVPCWAMAHSQLVSTTPEDGAILRQTPTHLTLIFAEPAKLIKIEITKFKQNQKKAWLQSLLGGKAGEAVALDNPPLDMADLKNATHHSIALSPLQNGNYEVNWRALSADGHVIKGNLSFTIEGL